MPNYHFTVECGQRWWAWRSWKPSRYKNWPFAARVTVLQRRVADRYGRSFTNEHHIGWRVGPIFLIRKGY